MAFTIEIRRDNDPDQVVFRREATTNYFFDETIDDAASAGSHTYNVYVKPSGMDLGTQKVGFRQLIAIVLKR